MNLKQAVASLKRAFQAAGTRRRAAGQKAYLKSPLDFEGVTIPFIRKTAQSFHRDRPDLPRPELIELVQTMWDTPSHDFRSLGIALLELYAERLQAKDIKFIEDLLRRSSTWDHVDWLSTKVAGSLAERHPSVKRALDRWSRDDNFWIRRASMLALLEGIHKGDGDFALFSSFASRMIGEKEFFIRKAIGWVLREASRAQPSLVYGFLAEHIHDVSGPTLREGSKYLPGPQQAALRRLRHG